MSVTLYTSRVLLSILGVNKYGVWNLLAGIIVLFSFVQNSMATAIQRYMSFAIGQNDIKATYSVLYNSKTIHLGLSLVFFVISEILGNILIEFFLNIPKELKKDSFALFQIILLNTILLINRIPYNSWIIAYEKMSFYSITSIIEGGGLLLVVFLLQVIPGDNLINYGILTVGVTFVINIWYVLFCKRGWNIRVFGFSYQKKYFSELLSFSSYTMLGSIASVMSTQGINVLINLFFGVVLNAAMGIAQQVNGAVIQLVTNFQTAFKPQIVKLYSSNNKRELQNMILGASRISFCLMWVLAFPLLLNTNYILTLWLHKVPEYAGVLCQFMIVGSLLESISSPLWMTIQATGIIKRYQITISCTMFFTLVLAFLLFHFWGKVYSALVSKIIIDCIVLIERLFFSKKLFDLDIFAFFKSALLRYVKIVGGSLLFGLFLKQTLFSNYMSILRFSAAVGLYIFIAICFVLFWGLSKQERYLIKDKLYGKK